MRHVLVVDDDPFFRDILARLLGGRYSVEEAGDGEAALRRCAQARPDLVMLDLGLPGMSGFGVVEGLASDPRTAGVPVVAFSAGRVEARGRAALAARGVRGPLDKLSPPRRFLEAALEASPPDGR